MSRTYLQHSRWTRTTQQTPASSPRSAQQVESRCSEIPKSSNRSRSLEAARCVVSLWPLCAYAASSTLERSDASSQQCGATGASPRRDQSLSKKSDREGRLQRPAEGRRGLGPRRMRDRQAR